VDVLDPGAGAGDLVLDDRLNGNLAAEAVDVMDHDDLRAMLAAASGDRLADGALVFTCNGRGERLFGTPDHDARAVAGALRTDAAAGMFCAGEIGPVRGRSHVHGFTASVVLFHDS
jgi:small ligand-binding sensory domain FIST